VRIVISVHDPPVWTIPVRDVERVRAALPHDEVVDARTPDERRLAFPDAEVIVATRITGDEFLAARRIKWIHTTAVGVGGLLPPEVVSSPVVVTNTRGAHAENIAEHAIALALAARRRLAVAAAGQAGRQWTQLELMAVEAPLLSKSCMLVVGLGAIGSRVASYAAGMGMTVLGLRRRAGEPTLPGVSEVGGPSQLLEFLARADVVVLTVPHTPETNAMMGDAEFRAMRPGAVLVNVARGDLVDEAALERAVRQGLIAGAALDAFVREPLAESSPLWNLPNVMITPHSASFGGDYWVPAVDLLLRNVERYRRGDPLENVVDKVNRY
jgi:phosphoglycerate dehydrogenase-like enzyme